MRRVWPIILIGVFLFVGGFMYDVMFAGIPYHDLTPEIAASYARHSCIASAIRWLGVGAVLLGSIIGIARLLRRRPQASVTA